MNLLRWWRELRNPKLKCDRIGHDEEFRIQKVRREPTGFSFRTVAEDAIRERKVCRRCHAVLSEWEDAEIVDRWNGVTMPTEDWATMKENGVLVMASWRSKTSEVLRRRRSDGC